jgi:tRNA pseudouridine38-40 synthase
MRCAVKFGYDGTMFEGFHRQKGMRTVEEELIGALKDSGFIEDEKGARFSSASRTDRGVSAIGNVFSFDFHHRLSTIVPNLNSKCRSVWFWGIAEVPNDFNPRHAENRWYRYHLPTRLNLETFEHGSNLFVGSHDFLSYTRRAEGDTERTIDSIEVSQDSDFIILDFKARRFLWNMIRRIVSALLRLEKGIVTLDDIAESLEGKKKFNFGLAPAEELVLMDVSHGLDFELDEDAFERLARELDMGIFKAKFRKTFLENMMSAISNRK